MTAKQDNGSKTSAKVMERADHVFSGDLTLPTAGAIKEKIAEVIAAAKIINISFQDVGEVDLSFVQVLCAAHRSAISQGKKMEFSGAWPVSFENLTREAGLDAHVGCSLDGNIKCPWFAHK